MKQAISLRLRITLSLILAIVLILGTATLVIDLSVDHEVAQRADASLLERAQALADLFSVETKAGTVPFPSQGIPQFLAEDQLVYFVINCRGQHVTSSDDATTLSWPSSVSDQPVFTNTPRHKGFRLRAVVFRFSPDTYLQQGANTQAGQDCDLGLAVSRHEVRHFQESMDQIEIGCVVLGFLAVLVLVPLLVTRGLRPLSQLADAMKDIGPENPEQRLGGAHALELRPLVARFNEVLSRMEEGLLRERQFASGVAHELRTPLAELRTLIEVELRYPSGRDLRVMIADVGTIGIEMERLVGALLLLTRIEAGIEQIEWQSVDVAALTQRLIERHRQDVSNRQLDLQIHIDPTVTWRANAALLDVLLGNLVSNALAYAPIGSRVTLHCEAAIWYVENSAPELTSDDVTQMGQRFWRKGKDAGVHTGLGLALAIAAARVQSMQLKLSLRDQYLRASVNLESDA